MGECFAKKMHNYTKGNAPTVYFLFFCSFVSQKMRTFAAKFEFKD